MIIQTAALHWPYREAGRIGVASSMQGPVSTSYSAELPTPTNRWPPCAPNVLTKARLASSQSRFSAAWRYRPGVVTQARCSRWDGRNSAINPSAAPGTCRSRLCQVTPSAASAWGLPGHRMNAKAIPDQRLHAMAPQKAGAAGGEDIGGHDAESSFSQFSIMTCIQTSIRHLEATIQHFSRTKRTGPELAESAPLQASRWVDRRRRAGSGKIQQALVETSVAFDHRNCPIRPTYRARPSTMLFKPLDVPGLFLIELERMEDERGFFSRLFCADTFLQHGLCTDYPQWSVSFNSRRGTLRGLHFQAPPQEEIKLVSCTRGAVFDVAVDLRLGSSSRGKWAGVELSADNRSTLYIPAGFAHGFQTLTDDAEVRYHISERYRPEAARGVRWDDPDLAIIWPTAAERVMSDRDRSLPRLRDL